MSELIIPNLNDSLHASIITNVLEVYRAPGIYASTSAILMKITVTILVKI